MVYINISLTVSSKSLTILKMGKTKKCSEKNFFHCLPQGGVFIYLFILRLLLQLNGSRAIYVICMCSILGIQQKKNTKKNKIVIALTIPRLCIFNLLCIIHLYPNLCNYLISQWRESRAMSKLKTKLVWGRFSWHNFGLLILINQ